MADTSGSPGEITRLLISWREGDSGAAERLFAILYPELRALARRQMRGNPRDGTLETTALLHEAYLKLVDGSRVSVRDRRHFFALAVRVMRQILVDHARSKGAAKRGGGERIEVLDENAVPGAASTGEVLDVDRALRKLEELDPRMGKLVELRFFGGLSVEETAEILDLSPRTVKREWQKARAFLFHELKRRETT